jgi:hypothetical protein
VSRGPKNRGNGGPGSGAGRGYIGGSRPPAPPRPNTGGTPAFDCLSAVVLLPLLLIYVLLRSTTTPIWAAACRKAGPGSATGRHPHAYAGGASTGKSGPPT